MSRAGPTDESSSPGMLGVKSIGSAMPTQAWATAQPNEMRWWIMLRKIASAIVVVSRALVSAQGNTHPPAKAYPSPLETDTSAGKGDGAVAGAARHRTAAFMVTGLLAAAVPIAWAGGERDQARAAGPAIMQTIAGVAVEARQIQPPLVGADAVGACRGDPRGRAAPSDAKITANDPVWKTVALGTYANARELREALRVAQCGIGDLAGEFLYRPAFKVSRTRMDVDLVVRSVAALGFGANGASLADIYTRARALGLELCPDEAAAELRLQYLDQPVGELLHIAMEPAVTAVGDVAYLIVGNGGAGLFIVAGSTRADVMLAPTVRFVFVRPRASASEPPATD
jgi:hypothetical protein